MKMCYDGALVMPSNYAVMDEEEMTYVEGGMSGVDASVKWWGIQVALNSTRTNQFAVGVSAVYTAVGAAVGLASAMAGIIFGVIGWFKGALITYYNNNNSGIYLDFTWGCITQCLTVPGGTIPIAMKAAMLVGIRDRW